MQVYCHIKPGKLKFEFGRDPIWINAEEELSRLLTEEMEKAGWNSSLMVRYRHKAIDRRFFGEINLKLETVKVEAKVVKLRVER